MGTLKREKKLLNIYPTGTPFVAVYVFTATDLFQHITYEPSQYRTTIPLSTESVSFWGQSSNLLSYPIICN
jgi:hypothetical protein